MITVAGLARVLVLLAAVGGVASFFCWGCVGHFFRFPFWLRGLLYVGLVANIIALPVLLWGPKI